MSVLMYVFATTLYICSLAATSAHAPRVVDHAHNITYIGNSTNGVESFTNIRYGKTTAGEWRFKHPRPFVYPQASIVHATAVGPACPQTTGGQTLLGLPEDSGIVAISEDCLNLRISRPAGTTSKSSLPVMVWLYGGGDENGADSGVLYNPEGLIRNSVEKAFPILYVALNYRVSIFGFANSEILFKEGSLNGGLRDQRLALEWIQSNIKYFGGDPSSVTLFGQSDGATGAGLQLSAYGGKGTAPFNRVILESDSAPADPGVSSNNYTRYATTFIAEHVGCTGTESKVLDCLRSVPLKKLVGGVKAWEKNQKTQPQDIYFPAIDGTFIPAAPSVLLREGRFYKNVSAIVGWAYNDASLFTPTTIKTEKDTIKFIKYAYPALKKSTINHLLTLYPVADFADIAASLNVTAQYLRSAEILRDLNFACPGIFSAQQIVAHGSPTYVYEFNQTYIAYIEKHEHLEFLGTIHTSEIPFVFNDVAVLRALNVSYFEASAKKVSGSWAHFAATGTPVGHTTLQDWPAISNSSADGFSVRVIGGPFDGKHTFGKDNSLIRRCAYVNTPEFYAQLQT